LSEEELLNIINEKGNDSQKEKFETLEKPLEEDEFNDLKNTVKKILEKQKELSENEITDKSEKDAFRVVKGLTLLKSVTLSPYLSTCQKEAGIEPTYRQYVESSPKIKYAIECIKTIHDYELENNLVKSGCVIYMNLGVNVSFKKDGKTFKWKESGFEKIKQYLINVMGYSAEEVSTVSGSLPPIEKERAKNKFLSGKSTVLIVLLLFQKVLTCKITHQLYFYVLTIGIQQIMNKLQVVFIDKEINSQKFVLYILWL